MPCNSRTLIIVISGLFLLGLLTSGCRTTRMGQKKYLRHMYHEIKDSLPETEVRLLRDSIRIIFPDHILFLFDSDELLPEILPKIQRFTGIFNRYLKTRLLITGHTDNSGEDSHNLLLSQRRADYVKVKMTQFHADTMRLSTWGLGSKQPLTENETPEGRKKNRRVELIVLRRQL